MAIPRIPSYSYTHLMNAPLENKVQWTIEPSRSVLLIHDVQQYFLDFYDQSAEPVKTLIKNIQTLKIACKTAGIPVVYTAQPAKQSLKDRALLTDFWGEGVQDEEVIKIVEELAPAGGDQVFTKWRYSAFQRTPLHEFMRNESRDQIIICGVYAHIGILATALEAFMTDIQAFVVQDAVADFSEDEHRLALDYISGRCGYITDLNATVSALRAQLGDDSNTANERVGASPENFSSPPVGLSLAVLKSDVAESLGIDVNELDEQDNLMDWGLDSIRLMALVEKWRQVRPSLTFDQLAEGATLMQWGEVLGLEAQESMACE